MPHRKRTLLLAALASMLVTCCAKAFDRDALGVVVAACQANSRLLSLPTPCLEVERDSRSDGGYAILREPLAKQRTILAALSSIPGIEDPRLLEPNAPNFFADAWQERSRLSSEAASDPWSGFALAINARNGRSQDRLHVHMSCLRPSLQSALAKRTVAINPSRFAALNFKLQGKTLWAMRVPGADLLTFDPIQVLADKMPGARQSMGRHLLIVVAERMPNGAPTFVLLTNPPTSIFSVEPFLDPACRPLSAAQAPKTDGVR